MPMSMDILLGYYLEPSPFLQEIYCCTIKETTLFSYKENFISINNNKNNNNKNNNKLMLFLYVYFQCLISWASDSYDNRKSIAGHLRLELDGWQKLYEETHGKVFTCWFRSSVYLSSPSRIFGGHKECFGG